MWSFTNVLQDKWKMQRLFKSKIWAASRWENSTINIIFMSYNWPTITTDKNVVNTPSFKSASLWNVRTLRLDLFHFFFSLRDQSCWKAISQPIKHWLQLSGQKQTGKHDEAEGLLMPSLVQRRERTARKAGVLSSLTFSPSLPGSCHGAVPSQLTAPLAGVTQEDYERHYKVQQTSLYTLLEFVTTEFW